MTNEVRWGLACFIAGLAVWLHIGSITNMMGKGDPALVTIAQVHEIVTKRYIEKSPPGKVGYDAIRGMVASLDPHSRFFDPEEAAAFRDNTSGKFGGLGIYITLAKGLVSVIAPIEGTPAAQAGILPGDLVLEIDGKAHFFKSTSEAVKILKGDPGSPIHLKVLHKGGKAPFEVTVKRSIITIESVRDIRLIDAKNKIGTMRIIAFQGDTALEVAKAMARLIKEGAKSVILDLRSNPGGLLRTATQICDLFLGKQKLIVTTKSRNGPDDLIYSRKDPVFDSIKLAILLDEGSASASEILAGALRDHNQAVLIGARSYGKGSVQSVINLLDGRSILKLTTSHYYTPSGRRINRTKEARVEDEWGLLPDIAVTLSLEQKASLAQYQNQLYVLSLKKRAGKKLDKMDKVEEFKDPMLEAALKHMRAVAKKEAPLIPVKKSNKKAVARTGSRKGSSQDEQGKSEEKH
jgi:carboxyl-terminal processing protease